MGRDYEFVAYRGEPLADDVLVRMLRAIEHGELYRHSLGSAAWARTKRPTLQDLHCIGVFEEVSAIGSRGAGAPAIYVSGDAITKLREDAARDSSLASLVQAAWKVMRAEILERAPASGSGTSSTGTCRTESDDQSPMFELARAVSRKTREAFWLLQGDHSCVGGYAHFKRGRLVDPRSPDEAFVDGDYVSVPERKWSAALGTPVKLDDLLVRYFPDRRHPPLRPIEDPSIAIAFDGTRFDFAMD